MTSLNKSHNALIPIYASSVVHWQKRHGRPCPTGWQHGENQTVTHEIFIWSQ